MSFLEMETMDAFPKTEKEIPWSLRKVSATTTERGAGTRIIFYGESVEMNRASGIGGWRTESIRISAKMDSVTSGGTFRGGSERASRRVPTTARQDQQSI
jgi:hypothetical protein